MPGQRPPRRAPRRFSSAASAVAGGVVCTLIALTGIPADAPKRINVAERANVVNLPTTIGFADSDIYGMSAADVTHTIALMAATRVNTIRLMIPWAGVEGLPGQLDWTNVDKIVNAAAAQNMSIIGFINSTPAWAVSPGGFPLSSQPASPDAYGEFAAKVATRYKGKIAAYEIWNEPNAVFFYTPAPDPAGYTSLLKAAYPRIKAVDPSVTVIGAALGAVIDWGTWAINPVRFLSGMYSAGAKGNFDALSFHPYQYTLKFSDGMLVANSPVLQLVQMRQLMLDNGDDDKRIWATEYGEPTSSVSEATQTTYLKDMYTKWQEMPYTGPLLVYTTRDRQTGSTAPDATIGVYRSDWSPKPAQADLRTAISAGVPKSPEFQRFSQITDPAHGAVLSPVFRATPQVWAQVRMVNTLFEMPTGYVSSPRAVADLALQRQALPAGPFAGGFQDFTAAQPFRVWWSQETGAHWASQGFAQAYVPQLGLATSDEHYDNGTNRVDFQHGYMAWIPWVGMKVYPS
ncbi:MAG: cellulase family glycosylhydrolase [Mycobacterium sp.]|nr:cellulase family glycosylhydrolase [Mycobacterium sp.]